MAPVAKILTFFFNLHHPRTISDVVKEDCPDPNVIARVHEKKWKKKFLLKLRKRAENIPHCQCRDPGLTPQDPGTSTKLLKTFPKLSKLLTSYPILS